MNYKSIFTCLTVFIDLDCLISLWILVWRNLRETVTVILNNNTKCPRSIQKFIDVILILHSVNLITNMGKKSVWKCILYALQKCQKLKLYWFFFRFLHLLNISTVLVRINVTHFCKLLLCCGFIFHFFIVINMLVALHYSMVQWFS